MKKFVLLIAASLFSSVQIFCQSKTNMDMQPKTKGIVTRISIGYFSIEQTSRVEHMLNNEFEKSLIPALKELPGLLGYYVGIDREKHAMTNVSFWQTKEDALQMATLKEMLEMRETFEALGIKFIDITNHDVLWGL